MAKRKHRLSIQHRKRLRRFRTKQQAITEWRLEKRREWFAFKRAYPLHANDRLLNLKHFRSI